MYVSAPGDPSPPSTSNFIPELPRNLIVVDSVFKNAAGEQRVGDMGALNQLMSAIVRKYTAIIPSVTIKDANE